MIKIALLSGLVTGIVVGLVAISSCQPASPAASEQPAVRPQPLPPRATPAAAVGRAPEGIPEACYGNAGLIKAFKASGRMRQIRDLPAPAGGRLQVWVDLERNQWASIRIMADGRVCAMTIGDDMLKI